MEGARAGRQIPFAEALAFWVKLGFVNFGGPTGQIALMHEEIVERRRWVSEDRFLHALNYCMLLPGPEAQQLAIYIGWLLNRTAGGIAAGVFFIVPSFFLMLALSWVYAVHSDVSWVSAVFAGLAAAVVGVVAAAMIRVGKKVLRNPVMVAIAVVAFLSLFVVGVPFPVLIITTGLIGAVGGRWWPATFAVIKGESDAGTAVPDEGPAAAHTRIKSSRVIATAVIGVTAWWGPVLALVAILGSDNVLAQQGLFFSKASLVTFGGAYAVLAYVQQQAVAHFGWVTQAQMAAGLGLAESTPGPLIMVTQFVGFLGAYEFHGSLDPVVAGCLGSVVTVWATFAPCFLWIFLGAPFVEHLRGNTRLSSALSAITAAIVGVIANLAVGFGFHTLFADVAMRRFAWSSIPVPVWSSIDLLAAAIAVVAFLGVWKARWNVGLVVVGCGAAGLLALLK